MLIVLANQGKKGDGIASETKQMVKMSGCRHKGNGFSTLGSLLADEAEEIWCPAGFCKEGKGCIKITGQEDGHLRICLFQLG